MKQVRAQLRPTEDLAKVIALPADYPPHRLPTFPALERTAVLSFVDTMTQSVLAGTQLQGWLVRNPAYPFWVAKSVYGSQYYESSINMYVNKNDTATWVVDDLYANKHQYLDYVNLPMSKLNGNMYFTLGGRMAPDAISSAVPWRLAFEFNYGSLTEKPSISVDVDVEYLDSCLNAYSATLPMEGLNYSPVGAMYVGGHSELDMSAFAVRVLQVRVTSAADLTIAKAAVGVCTAFVTPTPPDNPRPLTDPAPITPYQRRILPAQAPPEFYHKAPHWETVRCTAAAVLLTNVSQVMNKEGTVSAARFPVRTGGGFDSTAWGGFASVHPKDRYFGAMENGLYAYTLPDTNSEAFTDASFAYNSALQGAGNGIFDLDTFSYLYAFLFSDFDGASGSTLAVTVSRHTEFRTSSRLFPTNFSKYSLEQYHVSQMALANLGCFTENPVHLQAIAAMVRQAAQMAWPYVKPAAAVLVGKAAKAAAKWAGKALGDMTQKQMSKTPNPKPRAKQERNRRMRK